MRKVTGAIALTWGGAVAVFSGNRYRLGGVALLAILATVFASTRVGHAVPITTDDYGSTAPIVVHRLVVGGLASGGAEPALVFGAASPLAADGLFSYPLASWGGVTDRFGIPRVRGKVHTGLDLGLSEPVTVYAACDGVVTVAAQSEIAEGEGYGKYIVIQCDRDWSTLYAHLSRTAVEIGQEVVKGWPIALSGSTGFSTGQHLHFEIRYRGVFTDPVRYLNFGRLPRVSPAVGELPPETPTPESATPEGATLTPESETATPDATPVLTATPTGSATPFPSPEATSSSTATADPTKSTPPLPSATVTPTPTPTEPATATPAQTATASPASTATVTPTGDISTPLNNP